MIQKDKLVIVKEGVSSDEIKVFLYKYCIEKVFLVDDEFCLKGMVINIDICKVEVYFLVCKDDQG